VVEYAWRQPDGEIAPVLQTEGYTLMVQAKDGDYWLPVIPGGVRASDLIAAGWTPPGTETECSRVHADEGTHTNGYVVAADAFELAVKQMSDRAPLQVLRARAHWFYAEMLALAQTGVPDQA
jgi:hypothetical protein